MSERASKVLLDKLIESHSSVEIRTIDDPNNKDTQTILDAIGKEAGVVGKLPKVPEKLYTINHHNLLESMIFPLTKDEFFDRIYCKKALVIRGGSQLRFKEIIKDQMYDLNILKMLRNTSSKQIHVWNQPKDKSVESRVKSEPTSSPEDAYAMYLN